MTNILRRLEIVEKEMESNCMIPEKERIIVISYPDGDHRERERLTKESIANLKAKYGTNVNEDDLLVIGIRKFSREK